jgi:hypothetical protein
MKMGHECKRRILGGIELVGREVNKKGLQEMKRFEVYYIYIYT